MIRCTHHPLPGRSPFSLGFCAAATVWQPYGEGGEGITSRGLEIERAVAHAARGGDGGDEGRQGGHDDFDHDFDDVFLFVVHDV